MAIARRSGLGRTSDYLRVVGRQGSRRSSRIQRHQRRHLGGVAPKLVAHRAEKQEGRGPGAPLAAKAEAGARHSVTCRETAREGSPVAY